MIGFFYVGDVSHGSIRGCDDCVWIRRNFAFWITKKENRVKDQHPKKKRNPRAKQPAHEREQKQNPEDPTRFEHSLETHSERTISKRKRGWSRGQKQS